jgi:hypothetical protein
MTRWLMLGCGGLLLFVGIAGVLAFQFVIKPAQSLIADLRQVAQLDARVLKQTPYTPPGHGKISQEQLGRLMQVQRQVQSGLGERFSKVERRFKELTQKVGKQQQLDYRQMLDLFRDSGSLITEAKALQVKALNAQGFSPQEYGWVRQQAYSGLGLGVPNLDPQKMLEQIGKGDVNAVLELVKSPESPQNTRLVEPLRTELERYYPLTWFGL